MPKNTFFNYKIKIEIKTTATVALKNELKDSPMSEGNTSVSLLHYQMTANSVVSRNLACVINN